jgi:DNA-binding transcriptional LysR family regulator
VGYGETAAPEIKDINWLIETTRRLSRSGTKGRMVKINNVTGILNAALAGIGLASIPDYVAAEYPQLLRVLPNVDGPVFEAHLVYADALRQSKRVAAFRDFLVRASREWKY